MPPTKEFLLIQEEVNKRFMPTNPLTEAIALKLARTIYQQRRCEYLIDFARSVPTRKLDELPQERQSMFRKNVRKLTEKLKELKRSTQVYSESLNTETQTPQDCGTETNL